MALLYADEDFPLGAVRVLRSWGHNVLTVQEAGQSGKSDPEVLSDATADGRAVLTHNHSDFQRLHRTRCNAWRNHFVFARR
jgi:predicted nuclease of predicted toxin-antitoxin system